MRKRLGVASQVNYKVKVKKDKPDLKSAVDKIATVCALTNQEKKALKHALTKDET